MADSPAEIAGPPLWRLYVKLLPRERGLRAELRRIDCRYEPWADEAEGEERESRIGEYMHLRDEALEELEHFKTQELLRRAAKYPTVVIPRITMGGHQHRLDENWERGRVTGRWYLRPAAYARVYREIEDTQKRRREAWESRIKIAGALMPWVVALASLFVSAILAGRLPVSK